MSKKFLFFIVLLNLLNINGFAISEIIPLKKPIQTKEETQKKLLIDVLKPLPKPIEKTETKKIVKKKEVKKEKKVLLFYQKKTFNSRKKKTKNVKKIKIL